MIKNSNFHAKRLLNFIISFVLAVVLLTSAVIPANAEVISGEGKLPFEDIKSGEWYEEGLTFCFINGIISGQENTYTFAPSGDVTRAMFAVMLARAADADTSGYKKPTFSDCKKGSWYLGAVEWTIDNGYMVGSGSKFNPDKAITREELASVMMRYMLANGHFVTVPTDILDGYSDVNKISSWALDSVKYSVAAGLISSTSTSNKLVSPTATLTRAQAARIFMVLMQNYIYADCVHDFVDPSCTEKGYCTKCGLYNTLALGHRCEELACNKGGTCTVCQEFVEPDPTLHVYADATCDTPETCTVCFGTRGDALGHRYSSGVCKRCGDCPFDNVINAMAPEKVIVDNLFFDNGHSYTVKIINDSANAKVIFQLAHEFPSGDSELLRLKLNRTLTTCNFTYSYTSVATGKMFTCSGKYDPAEYSKKYNLTLAKYTGLDSNATIAVKNIKTLTEDLLKMADVLLDDLCGHSVADLGYKKY